MVKRSHRRSDQPGLQEAGVQKGMAQVGRGSSDKEAINDTGCYLLPSRSPVMASRSEVMTEGINEGMLRE